MAGYDDTSNDDHAGLTGARKIAEERVASVMDVKIAGPVRYTLRGYDAGVEPAHEGGLVSWRDYATLRAENEALRAQVATARVDTLEEAAKVADDEDCRFSWAGTTRVHNDLAKHGAEIAAAIRALKEKQP